MTPRDPGDTPQERAFFERDAAAQGSDAARDEAATTAMFYCMSAERLRVRCLWCGLALALTVLVPYEVIGGAGVFVWSVLPELAPAAQLAALAPALAGLFLLLLGARTEAREGLLIERPTSRAIAALAAFAAVNGACGSAAAAPRGDSCRCPTASRRAPRRSSSCSR